MLLVGLPRWKENHQLTEEECTLGHHDPHDPGQCRWCNRCVQWVRPKDFNAECKGDEPSVTW